MNIKFLIAQLFGLLAIVFLYLSFKVNRKKYVLRCQAVSNFGYAMEYLLLGGITGSILSFLCIIRNLIYQKFPNGKVPLIWLVICIFLMVKTISKVTKKVCPSGYKESGDTCKNETTQKCTKEQ